MIRTTPRRAIAREILGVSVRIRGPVPPELARLLDGFPPARPGGAEGVTIRLEPAGPGFRIERGPLRPVASQDPARLLPSLDWAILDAALRRASGVVRIHAGAVAAGGRGVLLPGQGGAGKTTLAIELCRRGASYLSDDVGAVHAESGDLLPFPKALRLRRWNVERLRGWRLLGPFPGWEGGEVWYAPPRANRLALGSPAPVAAVVFPRHAPALEAPAELEPLRKAEAAIELFRHQIGGEDLPHRGLDPLSRLAGSAPALRLLFRDAAEAAERLLAIAVP